jgi:N-formylglutamate amidohydrolase
MSQYFEILIPPSGVTIPPVVHVPHGSREIPENFRPQFALTDDELRNEILAMTDAYTGELFQATIELGGLMFVNRTSRLVMDPERFPDDEEEPMSAKGMGAIYTKTSHSSRLRVESFSPAEHNDVMEKLYWPYARALGDVVTESLDRFSSCLIIDAHSFPSEPLPYEDVSLERPDICLGYDPYHTPHDVVERLRGTCADRGWHVADNAPFAGAYVPLKYYQSESQVKSLMIEVNRRQYMNESDGEKSDRFAEVEDLLGALLECAAVTFTA